MFITFAHVDNCIIQLSDNNIPECMAMMKIFLERHSSLHFLLRLHDIHKIATLKSILWL